MKLTRIACLTGLVALSAWSVAACSDDTTAGTSPEAGDETGGSAGDGGKGTGGASGSAGKGSGGTAGKGSGGSAGKAGAAGSAGDGGGPVPMDGGDPSIKITDPKDKETISKDAEYTAFPKIPVTFAVANFVLKAPASANCPAGACGHIHINVDGNDCNVNATTPYNAAATTTTGEIDLGLCKAGVAGAHTITASLHNNDHTNVSLTDGGDAISDSITITAVVGDGGTSPDAGDGG
jgi:hypothetical protein